MYIFQNLFDSLVLNPGKKILAGFIKNELEEKLIVVADSPEKAELQKLIENLSKETEALKKIMDKDIDGLINTIESAMADSIIKESELEEIKLIIKSKEK